MQSGIQRCSILIFMDPQRPRRLKWSVGEGGGMRWEIAMRVVFNRVFVDVKPPYTQMAFGCGSRKNDGSWVSGRNTSHFNNINLCIYQGGMRKWLDKQTAKVAELLSLQWTRVSPTTATQLLLIACMQLLSQIRDHTMRPTFTCFLIGKADYYFIQPVEREVRGNSVWVASLKKKQCLQTHEFPRQLVCGSLLPQRYFLHFPVKVGDQMQPICIWG